MKKFIMVALVLALVLGCAATAHAGDALHRFMHNDQNTLAIGEITELSDTKCVVTVSETLVGDNGGYKRTQLEPTTMTFQAADFAYLNLPNGKRLIVSAAGRAEKAVNLIFDV